jgi:choline kinase
MTAAPPSAVILGAGRPARGQTPAPLLDMAGQGRVLDWQIAALRTCCAEVLFVGGYRIAEVAARYPDLSLVVNPAWASTGSAGSLLRALPQVGSACLVSYADVLYRADLVARLQAHPADTVLAIDSRWRDRYAGRSASDRAAAEVLQLGADGRVQQVFGRGAGGRPAAAQAEFVGLARFGPQALAALRGLAARPDAAAWDLPALINALCADGVAIGTVDCQGDWAELNAPQDVAHFVLGTKAETLARLQPMVRLSHIGEPVIFTLADWRGDGAACLARVQQAFQGGRVVVRSSALQEDGFGSSSAGRFTSVLDVDSRQAAVLADAVERVLASYGDTNPLHQLLVQAMVQDVRFSGVVMTRTLSHGAPYRMVNFDATSRRTDSVTAGDALSLQTLCIHRDHTTLPADAPPGMAALLAAVQEIEDLVGHDCLDIEFIVGTDGLVQVLQIRPIAVDHAHWRGSDALVRTALAGARAAFQALQAPGPFVLGEGAPFSVMSDWNPAEMIGTRPPALARSLYADLITDTVWAQQRAGYGYRAVAPQPLMRSFAGHAYIDVRASLNSFVPAALDDGLARRLVQFGIDRLRAHPALHDKLEFELVFSCLAFDLPQRSQALGWTEPERLRLQQALAGLTQAAVARLPGDLASLPLLEARQQRLADSRLPPLEQALLLLEDCRVHGTLPFAHLARAGFVAMTLLRSAVQAGLLTAAQCADYLQSVPTVATRFRADSTRLARGQLPLADFLRHYGHLRPGTYDLTLPSYAEAPALYLGAGAGGAAGAADAAEPPPPAWPAAVQQALVAALADLGLPLSFQQFDSFLRQAIAGREQAKFAFTRSVSRALDLIAAFGAAIGLDRACLAHVTLADLRAVASGALAGDVADILRARADEAQLAQELALGIELPPLLLQADDVHAFLVPPAAANFIGHGAVTADLVCLGDADAAAALPALAGRIVLLRQADPGHDWLFAHGIAGLVTAYGGANSHMAVRAAELALPAALGVGELRHQQLASARRVRLDCAQRALVVLA